MPQAVPYKMLLILLFAVASAQVLPVPPPPSPPPTPQTPTSPYAVTASGCLPGSFYYSAGGIPRCAICQPGCACPGRFDSCFGCSGGFFSAGGASACTACPGATTNDQIINSGCDPLNFQQPCANARGPMGFATCRAVPPAVGAIAPPQLFVVNPPTLYIQVTPATPGGPFDALGNQVIPAVPLFLPGVAIPQRQVAGLYDIYGQPQVMQSY